MDAANDPQLSPHDEEIVAFWQEARVRGHVSGVDAVTGHTARDTLPPPAWSFGGTPEQADALLALVLDGTKTATAGARWDYEAEGEDLPEPGDLSIVLDGAGHPRALIAVTDVAVVPFDEVDAEHAALEGEGDLSLSHWREVHREFFTRFAFHDKGFRDDMPVVCGRFRVLFQR